MYTQSYTLFNISFAIRMLEIFQSYPRWDDYVASKKIMWYLQRIKHYMLTYKHTENLEFIKYLDSDYVSVLIVGNQHLDMCLCLLVELSHGKV